MASQCGSELDLFKVSDTNSDFLGSLSCFETEPPRVGPSSLY